MKMRRNKFVPINSLKKTKVQFSTRLSGCLGEHQSQEFFERVNITRQSGICSKNKNNSFGDKRSNSFRQTLQLNVPFVADFSDSKQFCICYPVHFFRKKLHSYDSEDNRLASVRVYFPASRMKNGNDFKVSPDLKKRIHLYPYQFEFVGYSSLLTLSLEDLSLAVFRAKSSSEKFKLMSSLAIPKLLIAHTVSNSQTGTPIFIGTERIYTRILKLIACSKSDAFKLNNISALNSDSNVNLRKCLLKWIGLENFLPSSSRIIFVRRVSSDSGESLGMSILNSPGPKIKRSRAKEQDRLSIRMKQIKIENPEEFDEDSKEINNTDDVISSAVVKIVNSDLQDNKKPRGRPKKLLEQKSNLNLDNNYMDQIPSTNEVEADKIATVIVKRESLQVKSESTSNSMTDSTSEEKYSVQLSSCTTPDTNKSCSPVLLNGTVTTTLSSTTSVLQSSTQITNSNLIKNKRGRPRKYPLSLNSERKIFKSHCDALDDQVIVPDSEDITFNSHKRSNTELLAEPNSKLFKSSNSSISSNDGKPIKIFNSGSECLGSFIQLDININSIWRPLKHPLSAPDPLVPFIRKLSNTGLSTDRKLKSSTTILNGFSTESINKTVESQHQITKFVSQKSNFDFLSSENLSKSYNNVNICGPSATKSMLSKDLGYNTLNGNQYLLQSSGFNPLMINPMSYNNNNTLLSPLLGNMFNSNPTSFASTQSPIINTLASLFSPINPTNPNKLQPLPFFDTSCRPMYPNSQNFLTNDQGLSSTISNSTQPYNLQYNQILASKYDPLYSWNNDYQWKY